MNQRTVKMLRKLSGAMGRTLRDYKRNWNKTTRPNRHIIRALLAK